MRHCDGIHEAPALIVLGQRPAYTMPPREPVLVSFVPHPVAPDRVHFSFPMLDSLSPSELPSREALEHFLASVHPAVSRQASYWHCHAGLNRSAFGLAAYLHRYRGLRISAAIALLRERRDEQVLCNELFEATLRAWYGAPDEQDFVSPLRDELLGRFGIFSLARHDPEPIPLDEAGDEEVFELLDLSVR